MRKHFLFYTICLLFLLLKARVLIDFAFVYTDHDQCTLWHAAIEAAQGKFHEPCFYGQSYNSNLEAWLALPFIWLGVGVEYAVPLVTTIMSAALFLLPALAHYRRKNEIAAWTFIIFGLATPVQIHLIESMSRGFINGLFIASLGYALFVVMQKSTRLFILSLCLSIAFWINPNAIVFAAAVVLFHWRDCKISDWKLVIIGVALGSVYKIFIWLFYRLHPLYDYHKKEILSFEWSEWPDRLSHLDIYFFNQSWLVIMIFVMAASMLMRKKNWHSFVMMLLFVAFFLFTLALERVGDGMRSIYYHPSRMYLGMYLALAVIASDVCQSYKPELNWKIRNLIFLLCAALFSLAVFQLPGRIQAEFKLNDHGVLVEKVDDVRARFERTKNACVQNDLDLVVFAENCNSCWIDTYAIPALSHGEINTINLREDRRAWRFDEELRYKERKFLVLSCGDPDQLRSTDTMHHAGEKERIASCYVMQIENNVPDYFRPLLKHLRYGY